jgi:hypothetical protein
MWNVDIWAPEQGSMASPNSRNFSNHYDFAIIELTTAVVRVSSILPH